MLSDALRPFEVEVRKALHLSGDETYEHLTELIDLGMMQLWPGIHSVLVTEIVDTPTGRELNFVIAAGLPGRALREIRSLYPVAIEWGKRQGCVRATFIGREGWKRTFLTREDGWVPKHVMYVRSLDGEK